MENTIEYTFPENPEKQSQFRTAVREEILEPSEYYSEDGHAIADLVNDFNFEGNYMDAVDYYESWLDYDYHFILSLHAVLYGAKMYHATKNIK